MLAELTKFLPTIFSSFIVPDFEKWLQKKKLRKGKRSHGMKSSHGAQKIKKQKRNPVFVGQKIAQLEAHHLQIALKDSINSLQILTGTLLTPVVTLFICGKNYTAQFFMFRCYKWVQISGNPDLLKKSPAALAKTSFLCGNHFSTEAFKNKWGRGLIRSAIPLPELIDSESLPDNLMEAFRQRGKLK